jgi:hypothetical protein
MKRKSIRTAGWLISGLVMLGVCAPMARTKTSLKSIDTPQGGKIVFGKMDGAASQKDALVSGLRDLHKKAGEKPQVGRAFRLRNTDSIAVFFTVVDHSKENKPVAGLLIAASTGPKQVETALVSDDASRFGKSANPMLQMLSEAWHPSGLKASIDPTWCGHSSRAVLPARGSTPRETDELAAAKLWAAELAVLPQAAAQSGPTFKLHAARSSDGTASVGLPDSWKLRPDSGSGTIIFNGPNGESAVLNQTYLAIDPASPELQLYTKNAGRENISRFVYPASTNIAKAFPDLVQLIRHQNGLDPTDLVIDRADELPSPQGNRCVHVLGQVNPDGKGMQEMNTILCATEPVHGKYSILLFHTLLPLAVAGQERATMGAVLASFRVHAMEHQRPDVVTPGYEAHLFAKQQEMGFYGAIEQSFQFARSFNALEGCHPSDPWGYNSYQLSSATLQEIEKIVQGTAWSAAADALIQADPNRFQFADNLGAGVGPK